MTASMRLTELAIKKQNLSPMIGFFVVLIYTILSIH